MRDYLSIRDDFRFWVNSWFQWEFCISKNSNVARFLYFFQLLTWSIDRSRLSLSPPSNFLGLTRDRSKKRDRKSKSKVSRSMCLPYPCLSFLITGVSLYKYNSIHTRRNSSSIRILLNTILWWNRSEKNNG